MHRQAIARFLGLKALPAEIAAVEHETTVRPGTLEMPVIGDRMHDRDNQLSPGRTTRLISFTAAGMSSTSMSML